ncbi:MAG: Fe(3+) ABC transporter substrate-binding protein [Alphaproteobacteria bacterium]|nr:Fe(3+) ABC transporter substrate-binding protein [Alphaproteobacteria bacterium]
MRALMLGSAVLTVVLACQTASAEEVNVYSSRHYSTDQALYDGFTEATGITVNLIEAKGDALIERLVAEGDASPADVFITADASRLSRAVEAGLFQPILSDALSAAVPKNLRHPDGLWFGLSTRVRGIVYAKDRVEPEDIQTYEDLAGPTWQDRICIRSSSNVYNQSLVAAIIATDGLAAAESWAKGIVANFARHPQGGDTDQIKAVAAGECDVAIANHYYLARLITSDKPEDNDVASAVDIIFPNQNGRGTHANISGGGVVAHAPNQDAAVKFLEYLVTPEAQAYFADGNHEWPVVEGVKLSPVLEAWGAFKTDDISVDTYGANNADALKAMDRTGWQ